jgi:hypothetical protein
MTYETILYAEKGPVGMRRQQALALLLRPLHENRSGQPWALCSTVTISTVSSLTR